MKKFIHILVCLLVTVCVEAQVYVSPNTSFYIGNGGVVTVNSGDVTLNSQIAGAGTGRLLMQGSAKQNLNNNSNTVWGLEVNDANGVVINKDLTVQGPLTLTKGALLVNGNKLTTSNSITCTNGTVSGSPTSSFVVGGSAGTVNFLQTGTGNFFNNLTINCAGGVTLGNTLRVAGTLTLTSGQLNTGGNLILTSTANNTATVAPVTGGSINGTVTVERYIPAHRAWRLLTTPLSNTGTIYANWQNNGVADDTSGALIFAPGGTGSTGNGFTAGGGEPSIETYDPVANNWVGLTNTTSTLLSGTSTSGANTGIGLFVTGPYGSNNIAPTTGATATTLRATGNLQTGQQQFITSGLTAGTYILSANPYASPINFTNIGANGGNIYNTMWAWDAQRGNTSYGGYVTFSWDANANGGAGGYDQDFPPDSTVQTINIQSGEAFFVQAVSNGTSTVTINETDKASSSTITGGVFGVQPSTQAQQMRISLNRADSTGMHQADAVLAKFGDVYKTNVSDDAAKLFNYDENLSLQIDTNYLAIERRPMPVVGDTMLFNTYALKKNAAYAFVFSPQNIQAVSGVQAVLSDSYANIKTPVSLTKPTTINFNTGLDAGSLSQNRFSLLFKTNGILASAITASAWAAGNNVQVGWTIPNELSVKQYQVQRGTDALNFETINIATAHNSGNKEVYNYTDAKPLNGNNYYRIQQFNNDGTAIYSNVVLVKMANGTGFSIYPNPVPRKTGQLQAVFTNMAVGKYVITVYSMAGKMLVQQEVAHTGGNLTKTVVLPTGIAAGSYRVVLTDGNSDTWKQQVLVQ